MPITIERPHTAHNITWFSTELMSRAYKDNYLPQRARWPLHSELPNMRLPTVHDLLDEDALQEEYHDLVDLELTGRLTGQDTARLRAVEEMLNELDENDPREQATDKRVQETGEQIEAILRELQQQPLRP